MQHGCLRFLNFLFNKAANQEGFGPESPVVTVFSAEDIPHAQPQSLIARPYNSTAINATWTPISLTRENIRGKLIGYRVWPISFLVRYCGFQWRVVFILFRFNLNIVEILDWWYEWNFCHILLEPETRSLGANSWSTAQHILLCKSNGFQCCWSWTREWTNLWYEWFFFCYISIFWIHMIPKPISTYRKNIP